MGMENTSLTISLPRTMKEIIEAKVQEGRFSTPSEYIRSLIRDAQDLCGHSGIPALVRSGLLERASRRPASEQEFRAKNRNSQHARSEGGQQKPAAAVGKGR
jgi:Arc/MetJ-type ribon-helix-helix transcriptional regulator